MSCPHALGESPMKTMSAAVTELESPFFIMFRLDLDLVLNGYRGSHSAPGIQPEMRVKQTNARCMLCICQDTESFSFPVSLSSMQRDA